VNVDRPQPAPIDGSETLSREQACAEVLDFVVKRVLAAFPEELERRQPELTPAALQALGMAQKDFLAQLRAMRLPDHPYQLPAGGNRQQRRAQKARARRRP